MFEIYSQEAKILIYAGVAMFLLALIAVIMWQVKARRQISALESIDAHIKSGFEGSEPCAAPLAPEVPKKVAPEEAASIKEIAEKISRPAQEEPETRPEIMENNFNVGRSGRIFTKDELEKLIRD